MNTFMYVMLEVLMSFFRSNVSAVKGGSMKTQGTPMTMVEAVMNAIHDENSYNEGMIRPLTINRHVRDFLAQIVGVEMLKAESDETIEALKRLMSAIDKKPSTLVVESRRVLSETESVS